MKNDFIVISRSDIDLIRSPLALFVYVHTVKNDNFSKVGYFTDGLGFDKDDIEKAIHELNSLGVTKFDHGDK